MSYSVLLDPRVARALKRMNQALRKRITSALEELKESPERKGELLHPSDYWKIRVGNYRAIYRIENSSKAVIVLFVGHRSNVYDDFERLL